MKILMLYQQESEFGGMEFHINRLTEELRRLGHDVDIIRKGKIGVTLFPVFKKDFLKKYDVVHLHGSHAGFLLKDNILTVHTVIKKFLEIEPNNLLYRLGEMTEGRTIKNAKKIISVSDVARDDIKRFYGRDSVVIENAVDVPDKFFGFDLKDNNVVCVGRIEKIKNFEFVLRVAKEFNKLNFLICGNHNKKYMLKLKKGSPPNVGFLGFINRDRLFTLYKRALFSFFASKYEASPFSILESMAYGCPVVAPSLDYTKPYKDKEDIILYEFKNIEDAVTKIELMLHDSFLRMRVALNAYSRVKKYKWGNVAKKVLEVYEDG